MTTIVVPAKLVPSEADITNAMVHLIDLNRDRQYAFATGYLGGLVGSIAESHNRCRKVRCWTCWHIRRGLAFIAALNASTTNGGTR